MRNEIQRLNLETSQREDEVRQLLNQKKRETSECVGFDVEIEPSLQILIQCVEKQNYPLLWKQVQKMKTIIATTVCCEQSFSVLKYTINMNMKKTAIANITAKYHQRIEENQI